MKKLIVVADDFGLCASVNEGIAHAYTAGIVTEASLMLGSPGTDHALELAARHNMENVGLHLLLKHWREEGDIVRRADYIQLFESLSSNEIRALFDKETAEFKRLTGREPSHITSQYGIIVNPKVLAAAVAYAEPRNIPMRLPVQAIYQDEPALDTCAHYYMSEYGVRMPDAVSCHVLGDDYETVQDAFIEDLEALDRGTIEFILHPGKASQELTDLSSLDAERQRDLTLALDPAFKQQIEALGFSIVPFKGAV